MNSWCVYIILCMKDDTYYTGITNNIDKRIETHNAGKGSRYTRARLPVKLIRLFPVSNKSEALKLEYRIKQMSRLDKLQFTQ